MKLPQGNIRRLDDYINAFYDESIQQKINSTKNILNLTIRSKYIPELLDHDSLISALSRTLNDDHQKSTDLTIYLLSFFFILSNYEQFHELLKQFQVGKYTLNCVQYQLKKFDIRYSEYLEAQKNKLPEADKILKKLNLLISKQDKLFYAALSILRNLAEDFQIQKRMKKAGLIKVLLRMLERNNFHLLVKAITFLKKMVVFSQNKNQMIELGIMDKLRRFFTCENDVMLSQALMVYKNLCFDTDACKILDQKGFLKDFVQMFKNKNFRFTSILILYLLSINQSIRKHLTFTQLPQLTCKMLISFPQKIIKIEFMSLAINIAFNKQFAQSISEEELYEILNRALRNQDSNLLKFVKNILLKSCTSKNSQVVQQQMHSIVKYILTKGGKNQNLLLQLLGIISNIVIQNKHYQWMNQAFIDFIYSHLADGIIDDDIIFQTVMVVSALCNSAKHALLLYKSKVYNSILILFMNKGDDPQFATQLTYCMYQFLKHQIGLQTILNQQQIFEKLLQNIQAQYQQVRTSSGQVLDILAVNIYDQQAQIQKFQNIKQRKFNFHNKQWMESVAMYQKKMIEQNGDYQMINNGGYPFDQGQYSQFFWDEEENY